MPKLPPLKHAEFVRKLRAFGFAGPFAGGKHAFLRAENGFKVTIPNPHEKDISGVLQKVILRQAGIDASEWLKK